MHLKDTLFTNTQLKMNSFCSKLVVKNIFIVLVTSNPAMISFLSLCDIFGNGPRVTNVIISSNICVIEGAYSDIYTGANKQITLAPLPFVPFFDFLSRVMNLVQCMLGFPFLS